MREFRGASFERIQGASTGAIIMAGFGAAWLALGLTSAGLKANVAVVLVLPVFLLAIALAVVLRRRSVMVFTTIHATEGRDPEGQDPEGRDLEVRSSEKRRQMRAFTAVNVIQWLAIFGTVNLLQAFHLETWAIPAIVLIVGAHFLPLAWIFQARFHLATGCAMMLCAATSMVLPVAMRDTVECMAAGVILWASAAAALIAVLRFLSSLPFAARQRSTTLTQRDEGHA